MLKNKSIFNDINIFLFICYYNITAKIRYRSKDTLCKINYRSNDILVEFETPQFAVAPGQSIVFYDQDICLGGGFIEKRGNKNIL